MPSPFPGMDPYLESPAQWEGFHQYLIPAIASQINAKLPPEFMARIGIRVYIVEPENFIVPDVAVFPDLPRISPSSGRTAVLEPPSVRLSERATTEPLFISMESDELREPYIDIIAVRDQARVITSIELLSPTNKKPGAGTEEYQRKQRKVLASNAHFLEIDLLRGGRHSVAASRQQILRQQPRYDYLACLHRAGVGHIYEVWAFTLRDTLPSIPIPLTDSQPDVVLDLQEAADRVYRDGAFDRAINYAVSSEPPLTADDALWSNALLREKGLR